MSRKVPEEALGVLRVFFVAAAKGDAETMRFCLTKGSVEEPGWEKWPKGVGFEIEEVGWESTGEHEGEAVVVIVRVLKGAKGKAREEEGQMVCYLVCEEGAWKFDLARSMEVMFGGTGKSRAEMMAELARGMEGVTANLGEVMKGVFDGDGEDEGKEEGDDEDDDKDEDEEVEEEVALGEQERARRLNDENFRTAAAGLKEMEPTWAMQIEMLVGHKVTFRLDFDSLKGNYALVQPFIHQGMAAVVGAFPEMMIKREEYQKVFDGVKKVVVSGRAGGGWGAVQGEVGAGDSGGDGAAGNEGYKAAGGAGD